MVVCHGWQSSVLASGGAGAGGAAGAVGGVGSGVDSCTRVTVMTALRWLGRSPAVPPCA